MLHINQLTYAVAGRPLFERASAAIHTSDRVALIGRNGSGKTTLLKLISGELPEGQDAVSLSRNVRVGKVAQDAPSGPESLLDTVLAADRERTALLEEAETAENPARLAEVHERLIQIKTDSAPARAAKILAGLGFDEPAQSRSCAELSGGWRMRVALAALLFSQPDLLLLDEPTNHLDLEATVWLESFLRSYPGTLLLVSHDRDLLNRVPTRMLHIEANKVVSYSGNYDTFERTRRERLTLQAALQAKQDTERKHIQAFVDRFRYKASKARQAQSRLKALARMEPIASVVEERTTVFKFPQPAPLAPPIINLDGIDVGYAPDRPVLRNLSLRLDMDDRIALLGANGNGKSTLMRLLAGRLAALSGRLTRSPKLTAGYFAQDQTEELDLTATPLTLLQRERPGALPKDLRGYLGGFGFGADKVETPISKLSGGEKARLLFAMICRETPHLLLLDEPTNHLDVDSRQALVQAINEFDGAVILVSHDTHLIELVADRLWLVSDGGVQAYEGDLDEYRALVMEQRRAERSDSRAKRREKAKSLSRKDQRRTAANARAAVADQRRAVKRSEQEIASLNGQRLALERKLADPDSYNGPTAKLMALQLELGNLKQAIAAAEEAWLEAQSALEEG